LEKDQANLVWIDLEMTGLGDEHLILEIATLVTDGNLNILAEGPEIAVYRSPGELKSMEDWSAEHHKSSGLLDRVGKSSILIGQAESMTIDFLSNWVRKGQSPLCGNSVHTDRRFIRKEMPNLESFLHYRIIDVSTIKGLAKHWYPSLTPPEKKSAHLAMSDIKESVDELKWFRETIFKAEIDE
tara:strand:+ start:100 stop:651 length:552 start_codon:yes stop_codon:yes gene_type:complete